MRTVPVFLFVFFLSIAVPALDLRQGASSVGASSAQVQLAVTNEKEMADILPRKDWDAAELRKAAGRVSSLPELAATELLWRLATAAPAVDANTVFANALTAASPRVRTVAVSLLISQENPDAQRILAIAVARERDSDVIRTAIDGYSSLPRSRAIAGLVSLIVTTEPTPLLVKEATSALRTLTKATLPDTPAAWRDWWQANRNQYGM